MIYTAKVAAIGVPKPFGTLVMARHVRDGCNRSQRSHTPPVPARSLDLPGFACPCQKTIAHRFPKNAIQVRRYHGFDEEGMLVGGSLGMGRRMTGLDVVVSTIHLAMAAHEGACHHALRESHLPDLPPCLWRQVDGLTLELLDTVADFSKLVVNQTSQNLLPVG